MPSGSNGSSARRRTRTSLQKAAQDGSERIDSSASRKGRSSSHASSGSKAANSKAPQRRRPVSQGTRSSESGAKRHNPRENLELAENGSRSHGRTRTEPRSHVRGSSEASRSRSRGNEPARSRSGSNSPRSHARADASSKSPARKASGTRPASHRRSTQRIPIVPILAFVALAAIGLIASAINSGPQYSAIISVPGEALAETQAAEMQAANGGEKHESSASEGSGQSGSSAGDQSGSEESEPATTGQVAVANSPAQLDLSAIPSGSEVATFSAAEGETPSMSEEALEPIMAAMSQFTDNGIDAGFVFVNLGTGAGIAANADQEVYGASSIKGPFATYICESLIDGGSVSMDDACTSMTDSFRSNGSASVESLVTNAVKQSSNGAFAGLREEYGGSRYASWLTSLDVSPDIHANGDWFAWYSPRDAAKLWTETYDYLESGSETATWLQGLMEGTNVSYIRDGVSALKTQLTESEWEMPPMQDSPTKLIKATADSVSGYKDMETVLDEVEVANKAGWCVSDAGSTIDYDSTSDNGIVTIDGQDYLLCIMTGAPYSDRSAGNVANLAASLIAVYDEVV